MPAVELPVSLSAPRLARQMVTEVMGGRGGQGEDDIRLVVSELVANAVRYARTWVHVSIIVSAGMVLVEVSDDGDGYPAPRPLSPQAVYGRGLALVEALSAGWGVRADGQRKTVWCRVRLPGPPPPPGARAQRS